jgi:hypothetical protein
VRKRAQETPSLSSDSDSFDIKTPIVIHIHAKDPANQPPPPKKPRRTRATTTAAKASMVEEGQKAEEGWEHIKRQSKRSIIIQHFGTNLQSFLNYLNTERGVSDFF